MTRQGNGNGFHYGLEYAMSSTPQDVEATVAKLERKQNRTKKAKRLNGKGTIRKMQMKLKAELGNSVGKSIEAELNRKFRQLYKLRQKG